MVDDVWVVPISVIPRRSPHQGAERPLELSSTGPTKQLRKPFPRTRVGKEGPEIVVLPG